MTVGERIKHLSQDWFLTEPLLFAVLCTHALKRNDNMGCDMRCGKGLIEYNPERLEHFDDNQLALRLKAEVVRIILKHPYQRQPYNPRRDLMRLSSDLTLSDNLEGMDTIGLEPPHIFDIQRGQAFEQYYSLMADQVIKLELDADGDEQACAVGILAAHGVEAVAAVGPHAREVPLGAQDAGAELAEDGAEVLLADQGALDEGLEVTADGAPLVATLCRLDLVVNLLAHEFVLLP